jgi:hypothetical protein
MVEFDEEVSETAISFLQANRIRAQTNLTSYKFGNISRKTRRNACVHLIKMPQGNRNKGFIWN